MSSFHVFTMSTPDGRVTYAHQELDRLHDGVEGFITDASIDRQDGTAPMPLTTDEVAEYIRLWGPATPVWPPAERVERVMNLIE